VLLRLEKEEDFMPIVFGFLAITARFLRGYPTTREDHAAMPVPFNWSGGCAAFFASVSLTATSWLATPCLGAPVDVPPVQPEALAHWQALRFGMFIHWGPVALRGTEIGWSRGDQVPTGDYDRLCEEFNPVLFNAGAWARAAKDAGMKYMVFVTKHHDGFCLWPSAFTEHDVDRMPQPRDFVKELAEACRREGLAFGAYYSVCDWYHPAYPKGSPRGRSSKPNPDLDAYAAYLRNQVRELVEGYGPLLTVWFDIPRVYGSAQGLPAMRMLRELQPDILINNRAYEGDPAPVGDYDTPEQKIGGFNRERPWETCMTICRQWAWKPNDKMKSLAECLHTLLRTAGGDGNLLLNVGPMLDGRIEARQVERLKEMGGWLGKYGATVYGTRGGPYKPSPSLVSTCRGKTINLFVLSWPESGRHELPAPPVEITAHRTLTGGEVHLAMENGRLVLERGDSAWDGVAAIIQLEVAGDAFAIEPSMSSAIPHTVVGDCKADNVFRNLPQHGPGMAFDGNLDTRWATDAGIASTWIEFELPEPEEVSGVVVQEAAPFSGRVGRYVFSGWKNGGWQTLSEGPGLGKDGAISFDSVRASRFKLELHDCSNGPTLAEIRLVGTP
jgi:alpha-L-fucosidase